MPEFIPSDGPSLPPHLSEDDVRKVAALVIPVALEAQKAEMIELMADLILLRDQRDAALAVIEKAPHSEVCERNRFEYQNRDCTCWKSKVDTSALAERDAEKWDEGWSARYDMTHGLPAVPNPYRALPEMGADRA